MDIPNATGVDVQSKLSLLIDAFTASPFRAAPERESEMVAIQEELGFRIRMDSVDREWMFECIPLFGSNQIKVSLRSLERLWAYCYAYTVIITELRWADGIFAKIKNPVEFELAFGLLNWAGQSTLHEKEGEWPDFLPDPRYKDISEHVEAANHYFLMTSGRILLHEIAHSVLGHTTTLGASSEILMKEEFEADAWADNWMLSKWREYDDNENVFIGRCMGIAFCHALPLAFGVGKQGVSDTHPNPIHRIIEFMGSHIPGGNPVDRRIIDLPCGFLLAIVGILLQSKNLPYECKPIPSTYSELFGRFTPYFR